MSSPPSELDGVDLQALNAALASLPDQGANSFGRLVAHYREFVDSLKGYAFSIYDYDNDVSVRELIDTCLALVSAPVRERATAALSDLDREFESRTREVCRSFGSGSRWSRRLPVAPGLELQSDIDSGNL